MTIPDSAGAAGRAGAVTPSGAGSWRRRRRLGALAAVLALAVLPALPARASAGTAPEDCFVSERDPRLAGWTRAVEDACRVGRAQIGARLGLSAPPEAVIRCFVATRESRRLPYDDWRFATTTTLPDGSIEVFFAAEAIASGAIRLPETAVHEMAHAVMRARMGTAYAAVDPWFREGVAVWVAGQGEDRLDTAITRAMVPTRGVLPRPEALLDGLVGEVGAPHGADDYAEDFLALRWLERRSSVDGVGSAVRKVVGGVAPLVAVAEVTGVDPDVVPARVDDFARVEIADALRRLRASGLRSCGRSLDRGRPSDAAECFARFLERTPASPIEHGVRMLHAVALQRAGDPAGARRTLAVVAESGSPFADEAHHRIASSLEAEGRPGDALQAACNALRNGFTRHSPELSYIAGRSLMRLDRPAEALPWLERVVSRYPTSPKAEAAAHLAAEARRRLRRERGEPPDPLGGSPGDADGGSDSPPGPSTPPPGADPPH